MHRIILGIFCITAGLVFILRNYRMVQLSMKLRKDQSADLAKLIKTQYYIAGIGFILMGIIMFIPVNW